jgi:hypothetical protein
MCTSSLTIYLFSFYCYLRENQSHWHMWPCRSMFNLRNVQRSDSHHDLPPLLLPLHLSTATKWTFLAQSETTSFLRLGLLHHPQISNMTSATSVWRSSYKTGKRPRLDRTITDQDRKIPRPIETVTAVRSSVHHHFKIFKTDENRSQLVPTGLFSLKYVLNLYSISPKVPKIKCEISIESGVWIEINCDNCQNKTKPS